MLYEYYKLIERKGGRVLKNRTIVRGIEVGNKFSVQRLDEEFEVLFFFKDKVFNNIPMIFGKSNKSTIMISIGLITKI